MTPDYQRLFPFVAACETIAGHPIYHPEGSVLNHLLQTFRCAMRESTDHDLVLAALLHDIGKAEDKLRHVQIAVTWLDGIVPQKTLWLIENHMRVWYLLLGDMKKRSKVLALYQHQWLPDLIMLARWDKMGRKPNQNLTFNAGVIEEKLRGIL